jgi:hypothetical protein
MALQKQSLKILQSYESDKAITLLIPYTLNAFCWRTTFIKFIKIKRNLLKGQSHKIFDPQFFSLNCTPGSPAIDMH